MFSCVPFQVHSYPRLFLSRALFSPFIFTLCVDSVIFFHSFLLFPHSFVRFSGLSPFFIPTICFRFSRLSPFLIPTNVYFSVSALSVVSFAVIFLLHSFFLVFIVESACVKSRTLSFTEFYFHLEHQCYSSISVLCVVSFMAIYPLVHSSTCLF